MPSVLDSIRALRPLIEEHAAADPHGDVLAGPVADALLRQTDLIRAWLPSTLGGLEIAPTEMLEIGEELAYMDGSTGWVSLAAVFATIHCAAFCPDGAAHDLWGSGSYPIMAGASMPGVAEVTDGGYLVTGKWSYGSGIKHATHIYTCTIAHEGGEPRFDSDGNPEYMMVTVPIEQVELGGNWDVLGLERTGSVDYRLHGVFVPEAFTNSPSLTIPERGGYLYTLGMMGLAAVGHTSFALGIGKRALEELNKYLARRSDRAESEHVQVSAGEAYGKMEAARRFVYGIWSEIDELIQREEPLSTRHQTLYRLALHHATFVAAEVAEFAYRIAGGTSLRAGSLQQCFRDANAATQHIIVSDRLIQACGREMLGLAPGQVWIDDDKLGPPPATVGSSVTSIGDGR